MSKRYIAPIEDGRIRLRLLDASDLPMTLRWRNQDQIRKWFFNSDVIALDQHHAWFQQYSERDDDFVFIIEEIQTLHCPVGQVALYHIDWAAKRAEFGRLMIGEAEAAGKGLAHDATALLVNQALSDWGLQEVYLEMFANNTRALAIYKGCGFENAGRRADMVSMSKRREDNAR